MKGFLPGGMNQSQPVEKFNGDVQKKLATAQPSGYNARH